MYIVNLYKRNLKLVMTCLFFFILFAYRTKEKLTQFAYIFVYILDFAKSTILPWLYVALFN